MPCIPISNHQLPRLNIAYLAYLNKKHERKRVSMGKSAKVIDQSMAAVGAVSKGEEEGEGGEGEGGGRTGENAFRDLTDFENEDFVYVF